MPVGEADPLKGGVVGGFEGYGVASQHVPGVHFKQGRAQGQHAPPGGGGGVVIPDLAAGDGYDRLALGVPVPFAEAGADMIVCTGGMSVDPDDKTPLAIRNVCGGVVTYGAPVLPGAMFLLAYYGDKNIPVMGLPGCVMYAKRTIFDLVLPRVVAGEILSREDFDRLGQGGLCLGCDVCTFPNCGFGK